MTAECAPFSKSTLFPLKLEYFFQQMAKKEKKILQTFIRNRLENWNWKELS